MSDLVDLVRLNTKEPIYAYDCECKLGRKSL